MKAINSLIASSNVKVLLGVSFVFNVVFNVHVTKACSKSVKKLGTLTRLFKLMHFEKVSTLLTYVI